MSLDNSSLNGITQIQNFIGGEFLETYGFLDSYDPSKDVVWARIPDSIADDVNIAVKAAKVAFKSWSKTSVQERSQILMKVADLMEADIDMFAQMESRDQGKPISLARTIEIPRAIQNFRFFATTILHQTNMSTFQDTTNALSYTNRSPVGVAALISPWNLPLYLLSFKLAPAIGCGNTVVCKPSEITSVTAWMLCKVFNEAGLPPGVVNMVFGTGQKAGDALVRHPDVSLISFTGSTATASKIRIACAYQCKKMSFELGGKNAAIIFDDADLDKCIPTVTRSSFLNQGEVCLCTSRIFVQAAIYDKFVEKFVNSARKINVGDPRSSDTWMGALVSREHMNKVTGYIHIAEQEGAQVLTGKEAGRLDLSMENSKGYFVPPTIIAGISDRSCLMQEEIFGPVVCIVPFVSESEVIDRANDVMYGLCASLWSSNVNRIHRVAEQLQVGMISLSFKAIYFAKLNKEKNKSHYVEYVKRKQHVKISVFTVGTVWANCWLVRDLHMPFGGIKSSGIGREGFHDSIDFYTEVKVVCVQINAEP